LKQQIKDAEKKIKIYTAFEVVSGSNPVFPYQKDAFLSRARRRAYTRSGCGV
jgi:hypothetical protein